MPSPRCNLWNLTTAIIRMNMGGVGAVFSL